MSSNVLDLFVGNDNVLEVENLEDAQTGDRIEGATVTAQVKTKAGDNLGSLLNLTEVTAANYAVVIPASIAIVAGDTYRVDISVTSGVGTGAWSKRAIAKVRT